MGVNLYPEDVIANDNKKRCFKCPNHKTCGNPFNTTKFKHKPFKATLQDGFIVEYQMPDYVMSG